MNNRRGFPWIVLALATFPAIAQRPVEHVILPYLGRVPAFSHATVSGDWVYVSGTLGTRGDSFEIVAGGIEAETTQTLENIARILAAAGSDKEHVVKCNVYLADMDDFAAMNRAYIAFFGERVPARTTVGVAGLALGAKVEIECVARKAASMEQTAKAVFRTSGFVQVVGDEVYYESFGEGKAVVLSHGLGGNHAIWYQQVPVLAQSYRVITWDQRGFGRSTNRSDAAGPKTAAEDLAAVLNHLGIDKAHVVGQSMGGWAVLGFALAHPDRVLSITFADTIGGIYTPAIEAGFDDYIRRSQQGPPPDQLPITRHPALGEMIAARHPTQAFLYSQIGSVAPPAPANMGALLRSTRYDLDKVRKLEVPALFIVGANDPIFSPAMIREAAQQLPNSKVVEIPDSGHSPYFEQPEAWNRVLLAFLESLPR